MTLEKAYKKATEHIDRTEIDHCVEVSGGWVFLGKLFMQAIYIDDNGIRGLSPSLEKDKEILSEAERKIKSGDFY